MFHRPKEFNTTGLKRTQTEAKLLAISHNLKRIYNETIQNACKGKAKGASVSVKYNGQSIPGKCNVTFKPDMKK